jgi:hypothetical protein
VWQVRIVDRRILGFKLHLQSRHQWIISLGRRTGNVVDLEAAAQRLRSCEMVIQVIHLRVLSEDLAMCCSKPPWFEFSSMFAKSKECIYSRRWARLLMGSYKGRFLADLVFSRRTLDPLSAVPHAHPHHCRLASPRDRQIDRPTAMNEGFLLSDSSTSRLILPFSSLAHLKVDLNSSRIYFYSTRYCMM